MDVSENAPAEAAPRRVRGAGAQNFTEIEVSDEPPQFAALGRRQAGWTSAGLADQSLEAGATPARHLLPLALGCPGSLAERSRETESSDPSHRPTRRARGVAVRAASERADAVQAPTHISGRVVSINTSELGCRALGHRSLGRCGDD